MLKFGRNYELLIGTQSGQTLTVRLPFTIEFDITRNTLSSANVCQVRIYNLSKQNREDVAFNAYNQGQFRSIVLRAGYGDVTSAFSTIFAGNISAAWSVREGSNFITQIECYDGGFGFVNGDVNISFEAGTPLTTVIRTLMELLPDVTVGSIGEFEGTLSRGNTYSGNPAQLLFEITGGCFFVDGGKAYALKAEEYISDNDALPASQQAIVISADTGLLNTPVVEQTLVRFEMLFEPQLNVGRLGLIRSETFPALNGVYKITSVKHRGMISETVAGTCVTIGEFNFQKENVGVAIDAPTLGSSLLGYFA